MTNVVKKTRLGPGLEVSEVLTGLWQIADMERFGSLDPGEVTRLMGSYVEAGFTTFDMADHYGSAELLVGSFLRDFPGTEVECLTKWVPKPGPITREDTRRVP